MRFHVNHLCKNYLHKILSSVFLEKWTQFYKENYLLDILKPSTLIGQIQQKTRQMAGDIFLILP